MYRVGIDIGGTFTDFCVLEEASGAVYNSKVLSTPADLAEGVMNALDEFFGNGRNPEDVSFLFHATTIATNALLERKGAKTWLCITEGFTGVYETPELGETRSATYDYLTYPKPPMLVRQRETIQIPERVDFKGNVLRALDEAEARKRLARLKGSGVESVAVSLIFSFMNPAHEQRVRELIHEVVPEAQVYLSCETLPQIREYPRLTTTIVNAYVAPVVNRYIHRLEEALQSRRITKPLYIMQSNGGSLTGGALRDIPVRMIESGPAAGVLGAAHIGRMTNQLKIISFDMGGTTAKAGIVEDGEPRIVPRFQAGEWLISTPSLDLVEIGAGGGSIAWIDKSGLVKVGPQSAGADPGPACYPNGGALPTVTDADVVLGWLNPEFFVGGKFHLNAEAARASDRQTYRRAAQAGAHRSGQRHNQDRRLGHGRGVAAGDRFPRRRSARIYSRRFRRRRPGACGALGAGTQDSSRSGAGLARRALGDGTAGLGLEARLCADPFRLCWTRSNVAEVERRFEAMEAVAQQEFESQGIPQRPDRP